MTNPINSIDLLDLKNMLDNLSIDWYISDVTNCLCFHHNGVAYQVDRDFDYYKCKKFLEDLPKEMYKFTYTRKDHPDIYLSVLVEGINGKNASTKFRNKFPYPSYFLVDYDTLKDCGESYDTLIMKGISVVR